jgi:tetratricopeptide (TPR) repeat protein
VRSQYHHLSAPVTAADGQPGGALRCLHPGLDSLELSEEAVRIAESAGLSVAAAKLIHEIGVCYMLVDHFGEALEHLNEGRRRLAAMGTPAVHFSISNIDTVHLRRGEFEAARACYEEALALARQTGDEYSVARWTHNIALSHYLDGNRTAAQELALASARLYRQCGDFAGEAQALGMTGS